MSATQENAVDLHSVGESLSLVMRVGAKHMGKTHHRIDHESSEEEQRHSSTLSLTSALDWGWLINATPRPFYPREREPVPIV